MGDQPKVSGKQGHTDAYTDYIPSENSLVVRTIDGLALEERLGVDETIMPPCFTGLCWHCVDPSFVNYNSAVEIQCKLEKEEVHLAKEVGVIAIGLIHRTASTIIPVCLSPTCKTDDVIGKSTDTYKYLLGLCLKSLTTAIWTNC